MTVPCDTCNESGELLRGFEPIRCPECAGTGWRLVECDQCHDALLLGGIPCECSQIGV